MSHRYAVGQMLEIRSSHAMARQAGPCEVVFRLPHDRGPVLYRVRPINEKTERVVAETDLTPSIVAKPDSKETVPAFSIAITR